MSTPMNKKVPSALNDAENTHAGNLIKHSPVQVNVNQPMDDTEPVTSEYMRKESKETSQKLNSHEQTMSSEDDVQIKIESAAEIKTATDTAQEESRSGYTGHEASSDEEEDAIDEDRHVHTQEGLLELAPRPSPHVAGNRSQFYSPPVAYPYHHVHNGHLAYSVSPSRHYSQPDHQQWQYYNPRDTPYQPYPQHSPPTASSGEYPGYGYPYPGYYSHAHYYPGYYDHYHRSPVQRSPVNMNLPGYPAQHDDAIYASPYRSPLKKAENVHADIKNDDVNEHGKRPLEEEKKNDCQDTPDHNGIAKNELEAASAMIASATPDGRSKKLRFSDPPVSDTKESADTDETLDAYHEATSGELAGSNEDASPGQNGNGTSLTPLKPLGAIYNNSGADDADVQSMYALPSPEKFLAPPPHEQGSAAKYNYHHHGWHAPPPPTSHHPYHGYNYGMPTPPQHTMPPPPVTHGFHSATKPPTSHHSASSRQPASSRKTQTTPHEQQNGNSKFVTPSEVPKSNGAYSKILQSEGKLTERKIQQNKAWFQKLDQLKEFKAKHGHCNVPQKYEPNQPLGTWVNKQRMEYKLLMDGVKSSMTKERIESLEAAGFKWAKRKGSHTWHEKYQKLLEYKEKHGDCLIPTKYSKDMALGRWVSTQREQYRLYMTNDPRTKITPEKIAMLSAAGFVWRLQF